MSVDPITAIITAALTTVVFPLLYVVLREVRQQVKRLTQRWLVRYFPRLQDWSAGETPSPEIKYSERLQLLTTDLNTASTEVTNLLHEMEIVAKRREATVSDLEKKLAELMEREVTLKSRIDTLSAVSPEAAKEFVNLMERQQAKSDRRSAQRDYIIFVMGVLASAVVSLFFFALQST
jgi:uncharacterized protein YceH (UPF0502 family)